MDELLVSWLGSDDVYENVLNLIENYRVQREQQEQKAAAQADTFTPPTSPKRNDEKGLESSSPRGVVIPPFYPLKTPSGTTVQRRRTLPRQSETWEPLRGDSSTSVAAQRNSESAEDKSDIILCVRDQVLSILKDPEIAALPKELSTGFSLDSFVRITKEICSFPSFFNGPLYQRILYLWNSKDPSQQPVSTVTLQILEWFWKTEMEPYDPSERFFRLVKQPDHDCILRDDFLPYIKALLNDHPVSLSSM